MESRVQTYPQKRSQVAAHGLGAGVIGTEGGSDDRGWRTVIEACRDVISPALWDNQVTVLADHWLEGLYFGVGSLAMTGGSGCVWQMNRVCLPQVIVMEAQ